MGDLNGSNWSDGQWFNFICGIITNQHLSPIGEPTPEPTLTPNDIIQRYIDAIYTHGIYLTGFEDRRVHLVIVSNVSFISTRYNMYEPPRLDKLYAIRGTESTIKVKVYSCPTNMDFDQWSLTDTFETEYSNYLFELPYGYSNQNIFDIEASNYDIYKSDNWDDIPSSEIYFYRTM